MPMTSLIVLFSHGLECKLRESKIAVITREGKEVYLSSKMHTFSPSGIHYIQFGDREGGGRTLFLPTPCPNVSSQWNLAVAVGVAIRFQVTFAKLCRCISSWVSSDSLQTQ